MSKKRHRALDAEFEEICRMADGKHWAFHIGMIGSNSLPAGMGILVNDFRTLPHFSTGGYR